MNERPNNENLCEICQQGEVAKLCDYVTGYIITSSSQTFPTTCDVAMCQECAVHLGGDCDFCPRHAEVAKDSMNDSIKN